MSSKHINDDHFETKVCTDIIISIRTLRYLSTYTSWREFIATQQYISNYQKSAVYHFDTRTHMHARTRKYTLLLNSFPFTSLPAAIASTIPRNHVI